MNAAILKCVNDLTKSATVTATGIHPVDFNLQITDNNTGETTDAHYLGTVAKSADQMIAATATIPWIKVVGRMAISLGATQANVLTILKDAILDAVKEGDDISAALQAMDIRVAGTVEMLKRSLSAPCPRFLGLVQPRSS